MTVPRWLYKFSATGSTACCLETVKIISPPSSYRAVFRPTLSLVPKMLSLHRFSLIPLSPCVPYSHSIFLQRKRRFSFTSPPPLQIIQAPLPLNLCVSIVIVYVQSCSYWTHTLSLFCASSPTLFVSVSHIFSFTVAPCFRFAASSSAPCSPAKHCDRPNSLSRWFLLIAASRCQRWSGEERQRVETFLFHWLNTLVACLELFPIVSFAQTLSTITMADAEDSSFFGKLFIIAKKSSCNNVFSKASVHKTGCLALLCCLANHFLSRLGVKLLFYSPNYVLRRFSSSASNS